MMDAIFALFFLIFVVGFFWLLFKWIGDMARARGAQPLAVVVHFTRLVPLRIDLCPLALLPDQGSAAEATHARLVGRSCRHLLKHREGLSRVCPGETIRFGLSGLHAGMLERERV